jgi:hypothetical protein
MEGPDNAPGLSAIPDLLEEAAAIRGGATLLEVVGQFGIQVDPA